MRSLSICPAVTACKCSQIAPMCQLSIKGTPSTCGHASLTNSCKDSRQQDCSKSSSSTSSRSTITHLFQSNCPQMPVHLDVQFMLTLMTGSTQHLQIAILLPPEGSVVEMMYVEILHGMAVFTAETSPNQLLPATGLPPIAGEIFRVGNVRTLRSKFPPPTPLFPTQTPLSHPSPFQTQFVLLQ